MLEPELWGYVFGWDSRMISVLLRLKAQPEGGDVGRGGAQLGNWGRGEWGKRVADEADAR